MMDSVVCLESSWICQVKLFQVKEQNRLQKQRVEKQMHTKKVVAATTKLSLVHADGSVVNLRNEDQVQFEGNTDWQEKYQLESEVPTIPVPEHSTEPVLEHGHRRRNCVQMCLNSVETYQPMPQNERHLSKIHLQARSNKPTCVQQHSLSTLLLFVWFLHL